MDRQTDGLKSYKQQMYKVGYGPNLWGIISEDSLHLYDYIEGAIEWHSEREIFYVEEKETESENFYNYDYVKKEVHKGMEILDLDV